MHRFKTLLLLMVAFVTFGLGHLRANSSEEWNDFVQSGSTIEVALLAEPTAVRPGEVFTLALQFDVPDPWHCYWQNPGDTGLGPQLQWTMPPGFSVLDINWPAPTRFEAEQQIGFGYDAPFTLLAQVQAPNEARPGEIANITVDIQWVACSHDMCSPGSAQKSVQIPIASATSWGDRSLFANARKKIPQPIKEARAIQKDGMLALQTVVETADDSQVEFFPADEEVINHKQPPVILSSGKNLALALEAHPDNKNTTLRGVIVVHGSTGKKSYSIDAPIDTHNSELVAMLDARRPPVKMEEPVPPVMEFEGGLLLALGMAFLGGMILNLMPCVLPVISFKILNFIKMAGEDRKTILKHGLAFSAGVLISFWVLASLLLILQAYGRSAGWGFQLQEPLFVGILATVMMVFGLSMFGVFEFGAIFASWIGTKSHSGAKHDGLLGSFSSGILATAVATPCTGPFLGSAVGFAVTLPAYQALLIFTVLGLGMAFPYLLLAASPKLLRYLPKPGAWMESFKEFMGFVMLGSTLWLVWVFGFQTGIESQTLLLIGLFLVALACWIYGRWGAPHRTKKVRMLSAVLALILFAFGGQSILSAGRTPAEAALVQQQQHGGWENFDPERIADLQAQGIPVFVDFTAKWCLICQANHLVLSTDEVVQKMMEQGVVKMKADWTKSDPAITTYLRKFGRNGVPLYLLFNGKQGEIPQILPQVLTRDNIVEALSKLPPHVADNSK